MSNELTSPAPDNTEKKDEWTTEQHRCIETDGGTLLVSAAAGSGKTSVLIARIIRKIAVDKLDVSDLLVVTFTKPAAAEMKDRLNSALSELLAKDPTNRHLLRQQLLLPQAAFCTIDSFCQRLVREHFEEAGVSPDFRILDSGDEIALMQETAAEAIEDYYARRDPDFERLVLLFTTGKGNDSDLSEAICDLYNYSRSFPVPELWLRERLTTYDPDLPYRDNPLFSVLLDRIRDTFMKILETTERTIRSAEQDPVIRRNYLPALEDDREKCRSILSLLDAGDIESLKSINFFESFTGLTTIRGKEIYDPDLKKRIQTTRDGLKDLCRKNNPFDLLRHLEENYRTDTACLRGMIRVLIELTEDFARRCDEKKAARAAYGFSDVTHMALDLLGERQEDGSYQPTPLANDLARIYKEILIDEYQDTNTAQDTLFSLLGEQHLFMVGDVKQSIYGFRQAHPARFIERVDSSAPYDKDRPAFPATIYLGKNFRCRPQITDTANFICRRLMSRETCSIDYNDREQLVPRRVVPDPDNALYATELWLVAGENSEQQSIRSARAIAAKIREITADDSPYVVNGKKPAYGDVFILFRNFTKAFLYARELKAAGIPVQTSKKGNLLDSEAVQTVVAWLRYINDPRDDLSLVTVLTSDACGFTIDDLADIRKTVKKELYGAALRRTAEGTNDLAERCRRFIERTDRYRILAGTRPVGDLLETLYEEECLPAIVGARQDGEQCKADLYMLLQIARHFEQKKLRGLSAFVRYLDRVKKSGKSLDAAAAAGGDAVRLMTVHASKGLEAPFVFLAELQQTQKADSGNLLIHAEGGVALKCFDSEHLRIWEPFQFDAVKQKIARSNLAEELRILYVAMTRAKEKLFMVGSYKEGAAPSEKGLAFLSGLATDAKWERLPAYHIRDCKSPLEWILSCALHHPSGGELRAIAGRTDLDIFPAEHEWKIKLIREVPEVALPSLDEPPVTPPSAEAVGEMIDRFRYIYPHLALSAVPAKAAASSLTAGHRYGDKIGTKRPAFLTEDGLSATERGTAVHTFMQYADLAAAEADIAAEAERLTRLGLLRPAERDALDTAKIRAFLDSDIYRRMKASADCRREYPFNALYPVEAIRPDSGETGETLVVKGIADCVFVEEDGIVILDYKTDRVSRPEALIERYTGQMKIYAYALTRIFGKPLKECVLYSFALSKTVKVEV